MTKDTATDTGRWASEGGADPQGPATDLPAAPEPQDIPVVPGTPDAVGEPPPGREQTPPAAPGLETREPAPQEIGESG